MHMERASDDVYVFTSERYAQVTATLVVSGTVGVLIDTLPFPSETHKIAQLAQKVAPDGVRYVVYTQHQADHVYGAFLFPRAEVIAHRACRDALVRSGFDDLENARKNDPEFEFARLKLPTVVFEQGTFSLRLPNKTLDMIATPGHTPDAISVLLQEEKILFAGDTVMALPTFTDGDPSQLIASLNMIAEMPLDSIVQGHGEIILKGEIRDYLKRHINYIEQIQQRVQKAVEEGATQADARRIVTIESCGMQRVLLNGQVNGLHLANVNALYNKLVPKQPAARAVVAPVSKPAAAPKPAAVVKKVTTPAKPAPAKPAAKKTAAPQATSKKR
jgi:cyclase